MSPRQTHPAFAPSLALAGLVAGLSAWALDEVGRQALLEDRTRLQKLLAELDGEDDRMAQYRCAIALVTERGTLTAEGTCEGTIGTAPRGDGGFGYDPLFWPVDYPGHTMAEVSLADKNKISHRARAFAHLPALLEKGLA